MSDKSSRREFLRKSMIVGLGLTGAGAAARFGRLGQSALAAEAGATGAPRWTILIANDNCPDYTYGFDEIPTRRAMADIIAAYLDDMTRTDDWPEHERSRYNSAITEETRCFLEHYPERADELARRVREGRIFISPFLNNSFWGSQSIEAAVRGFYPARRLEKQWGIRITEAEHIELPSMPWGMATILAGCGIRWVSVPFLNDLGDFNHLTTPPLFIYEGPDGGRVRVVMDSWACLEAYYVQGERVLRNAATITDKWLPHYESLGDAYPLRIILASGTHGDLSPNSYKQVPGFTDRIRALNEQLGPDIRLVNGTLTQYFAAVDEVEARKPFLPVVRGCFGHTWEIWPVHMAKCAADMRENERRFLATEALLTVVSETHPGLADQTRAQRERAEWCWVMLGEHAWTGTNKQNRRHNCDLRVGWAKELGEVTDQVLDRTLAAAGRRDDREQFSVFNGLSIPRRDLVTVKAPFDAKVVTAGSRALPTQALEDDGRNVVCFVSPAVEGYGFADLRFQPKAEGPEARPRLKASATGLESPYYTVTVDPETGGIRHLIHRATGRDLVAEGAKYTVGQTLYTDRSGHTLSGGTSEVVAFGPVLARLRLEGEVSGIQVSSRITVYAELDRVDLDLRLEKPVTVVRERLCHMFPMVRPEDRMRIETPAAVIVPRLQPEGDFQPGAGRRQLAIQGFVDISRPEGGGVRIAPRDAFALRPDLGTLCFEALGNMHDYAEGGRDQYGVTSFRFRYSVGGYAGPYDQAQAVAWSRAALNPLVAVPGELPHGRLHPPVAVDPQRAIATCLKPADDPEAGGIIVRIWETAGRTGPLSVKVSGVRRAGLVDLVERDGDALPIRGGAVTVDLPAYGFAALRLRR